MEKITVLILVLGLAVPAQAWHLFPVRENIVTVKETNYVVTAGACVITLTLSLIVFRPQLSNYQRKLIFDQAADGMFNDINRYLLKHGLLLGFEKDKDSWAMRYFESLDHTEPNDAQRFVGDENLDMFSRSLRAYAQTVSEPAESTRTE